MPSIHLSCATALHDSLFRDNNNIHFNVLCLLLEIFSRIETKLKNSRPLEQPVKQN